MGRLLRENRQVVIELRADRDAARRRFTLAHELAHLTLDLSSNRQAVLHQRTPGARHAEEERLCDAIAAALLMPRDLVEDLAGRLGVGYKLVVRVAEKTRCSLPAATARVGDVMQVRALLAEPGRAVRGGHRLEPISRRPNGVNGPVTLACSRSDLWSERAIDRRGVWIKVGSRHGLATAQIRSRGRRRVVLLTDIEWSEAHSHPNAGTS